MKHKFITFLLAALSLLLFSACVQSGNNKTVYIGSVQVACEGVAPQLCLLYKENPEDEYTYLYDGIEGFEYEAGFTYELVITEEDVDDPPADGSSILRKLVEVASKTPAEFPAELSGTSWQLVSMGERQLIEGRDVTLNFEGSDGEINGGASCNQYFGRVIADGERLYVSDLGQTVMGCEEAINQQEIAYMSALQTVNSFEIVEGQLHLRNQEGELIFAPQ